MGNLKWAAFVAAGLFLVSAVWLSRIYAFLTVAFVLAYLLDPIVEKLSERKIPRSVGALVTLFVFLAGVALGFVAIVPRILAQGEQLFQRLPQFYNGAVQWLTPISEKYIGMDVFNELDRYFLGNGQAAPPIGGLVQGVVSQTFHLVTTILGVAIIPLLAYYLLRDYSSLYGKFLYVVPKRCHKTVNEIRGRLHAVLGGFIRGQLVVSTILAAYYSAAFMILRIELWMVLGLMAGFLNMIPYVGILGVFALTLVLALLHGASTTKVIIVMIVFGVGMAAEGSVLTPRIVGRKVGLGPLTLIVALLVGGELLGFVGMLLAVPVAAIAKVFIDYFLDHYRNSEAFRHHESS